MSDTLVRSIKLLVVASRLPLLSDWLQNKITWPGGRNDTTDLPLNNLGDLVVWNAQHNASTGALGGHFPWNSGQDQLIAAVATAGVRDQRYYTALSESSHRNAIFGNI